MEIIIAITIVIITTVGYYLVYYDDIKIDDGFWTLKSESAIEPQSRPLQELLQRLSLIIGGVQE